MLLLAVPVVVATNPIDQTWQVGWYDNADTDPLVVQMLSPEGLLGIATVVMVVLSSQRLSASEVYTLQNLCSSREPVPRGPPVGIAA